MSSVLTFLKRKGVSLSAKKYFVDAFSAMAMGLFASLLIGTILDTLADELNWAWLAETAAFALRCVCYAVYKATENALKKYTDYPVVFAGGVASNSMLRELVAPLDPIFAQPQYSTDNAMGVAVLAHRLGEM